MKSCPTFDDSVHAWHLRQTVDSRSSSKMQATMTVLFKTRRKNDKISLPSSELANGGFPTVKSSLRNGIVTGFLLILSLGNGSLAEEPSTRAESAAITIQLMLQSADALRNQRSDESLVGMQQDILLQLQILEADLQNEQAGPGSEQQSSTEPSIQSGTDESETETKPAEGNPGTEDPGTAKTPAEQAQDSEPDAGSAPEETNPPRERRRMLEGIWGHLPEAARSQILDVSDQRPLPKYSDAVKRYYESLSHAGRREKKR